MLNYLEQALDPKLTYHGLHHTLDVLQVCNQYIRRLDLAPSDRILLRSAALLHDAGFTVAYENHEKNSCIIASKLLPEYNYNVKQIDAICALIMATKIPQTPKSSLAEVLCDADLDYLGRDDFKKTGDLLYKELTHFGKISGKTAWNKLQLSFLRAHNYHTAFAVKNRSPKKEQHLQSVTKWLDRYGDAHSV